MAVLTVHNLGDVYKHFFAEPQAVMAQDNLTLTMAGEHIAGLRARHALHAGMHSPVPEQH